MKSKIYIGSVEHVRYQPAAHKFKYPVYFYGLDLDELLQLDQKVSFFGYNRRRPVSIHDGDYLDDAPESIREKLIRMLKKTHPALSFDSIYLVTSARYLNYVFNPVSFYYCYNGQNQVSAMVAEVNNTFGERHVYIPGKVKTAGDEGKSEKYHTQKVFHVSPFNNLEAARLYFSKHLKYHDKPEPVSPMTIRRKP